MPPQDLLRALLADRRIHILDDEGRPLLEQADPAKPAPDEVACPYKGRRLGRPMNDAALAQINRHWRPLIAELKSQIPPGVTLQQAFQVCLQMVSAPLLWSDGPLPSPMAARYKALVGFCQVLAWLLLHNDPKARLAELGSGQEFAQWVEGQGWLEGQNQVCAGTNGQIATIFQTLLAGEGPPPAPSLIVDAVALQTALVCGTYRALREGQPNDDSLGCRLLSQGRAPWLFAVTQRPGLSPTVARAMVEGSDAVESFLAQERPENSHARREELFWSSWER